MIFQSVEGVPCTVGLKGRLATKQNLLDARKKQLEEIAACVKELECEIEQFDADHKVRVREQMREHNEEKMKQDMNAKRPVGRPKKRGTKRKAGKASCVEKKQRNIFSYFKKKE